MKRLMISLALVWTQFVLAQSSITGTWEGELEVGPEQRIDVQFTFTQAADGSYAGVLNAPDQPNLTDIPFDAVSLEGNTLSVTVSAVSGAYQGTLGDGAIAGSWSQAGTSFDLDLAPYTAPVMTAEAFALIAGSWIGELHPVPGGELILTVVMRFETGADGEFLGYFSVPDQGASDLAINTIAMENDNLTVAVNQLRVEISGAVSADSIAGVFTQAGRELPIEFNRGEYEQAGLGITPLQYARIRGTWNGSVSGRRVVVRIEQQGDQYLAFLDSPDRGVTDIPIPQLSVDGDILSFSIPPIQTTFSGEIAAGSISGDWVQAGNTVVLELSRE